MSDHGPPGRRSGPHEEGRRTESPPSVAVPATLTPGADKSERAPRPAAWLVEIAYPNGVGRRRFVFLKSERASRAVRNATERGYPAEKTRVLLVPTARGGAL